MENLELIKGTVSPFSMIRATLFRAKVVEQIPEKDPTRGWVRAANEGDVACWLEAVQVKDESVSGTLNRRFKRITAPQPTLLR